MILAGVDFFGMTTMAFRLGKPSKAKHQRRWKIPPRLSKEIKYKVVTIYTMCQACDTINISKCVDNCLSINPTTLILSSLVSEKVNFDKESKSEKHFFFRGRSGGGGGGGGG